MKLITQVLQAADSADIQDRRTFIQGTGKGIVAASILGSMGFAPEAVAQTKGKSTPANKTYTAEELKPIKLKPHEHKTEQPDPPLPTPLNPEKRIGYALVGLGKLTLNELMPAFGNCKYAKPVALVSGDRQKALKVANQYGIDPKNVYDYDNYDDIKDNPGIDAVYIVLPNSMHEEFTIRAAKAGKHVLCEKPMATSAASAERMIDACKKAGKKLMIAYRIQYEPNNTQIKDWLRNQTYGKVKLIEMVNAQNVGDPTQWRLNKKLAGGGALPDIGIYCLNTARFILGEEPIAVHAHTYSTPGDERFKEVEETMLFRLEFASGVQVNCSTSYGIHEARRYRCYTDKGAWFGLDPAFAYKGLKTELAEVKDGVEVRSNPGIGDKNHFALEMDHFAKCLLDDKQPYTTGEEGLQDQRIIEALYESAKTGKSVKLTAVKKKDAFRGPEPGEK